MNNFKVGELVTMTRPIKDNDTGDMVTIDFAVVIPSLTEPDLDHAALGVEEYVWIRDLRSPGAQRAAFVLPGDLRRAKAPQPGFSVGDVVTVVGQSQRLTITTVTGSPDYVELWADGVGLTHLPFAVLEHAQSTKRDASPIGMALAEDVEQPVLGKAFADNHKDLVCY
jgi:uncharacterized protein YodC (DUF2158 family)